MRQHLNFANIVSLIALFVALGGTALASVIITSNSQVAKDTISGHKPPTGDHSNIIAGSVNSTDLANQAVTAAKIKAPEAWHNVGPAISGGNLCDDPSKTARFCTEDLGDAPWRNYGNGLATAGFYKDQLGIVHLKGVVQTGFFDVATTPEVRAIFRLPPAYRPTNERAFPSVGRSSDGQEVAQGRVDVTPDGLVELIQDCTSKGCSANGGYVALDGVSFRPDG